MNLIDEQTDSELVEAARRGDTNAFGELVRRRQKQGFAVALSLVGDPAEAEDLTQEAFIRAFRNLDLLADPGKFAPWLNRIVFGVCIDWLRAFRPDLYRTGNLLDEEGPIVKSAEPSPLEQLQQKELSTRVLRALDQLPPRYRTPITMYHIEGLKYEKVAQALDVPVGTVRSLVSRARRLLVPMLESYAREVLSMSNTLENVFEERPMSDRRLLHIHNGDSACETLKRSDVPGTSVVWADVLHEGPVPAGLTPHQFREMRIRFHSSQDKRFPREQALERHKEWDESLASYANYDEVIMWFEHDLFDQLILLHHLDYYSRQDLGTTTLSLICVGEYPGVQPFYGLGQLNPDQLASLLGTRQQVTAQQLELGRKGWEAFTAPDPAALDKLVHGDTSSLPFLEGALYRFLEEYPSTRNGLPRTERQILTNLGEETRKPGKLFLAGYPMEERVFMGDSTFWTRLRGLAKGPHPLIEWDEIETDGPVPQGDVRITDAGRAVRDGKADWVHLNGIDRWLGGVHLQGAEAAWRWDEQTRALRKGLEITKQTK